jgi:hypothetical protein
MFTRNKKVDLTQAYKNKNEMLSARSTESNISFDEEFTTSEGSILFIHLILLIMNIQ